MTGFGVWMFVFLTFVVRGINAHIPNGFQSPRCKTPTTAPQKIEKVIALCQEEIKLAILKEALEILKETTREVVHTTTGHRTKRELFTEEEQRIAGCLLQCVYRKVKAVSDTITRVELSAGNYIDTDRNIFFSDTDID